METVITLKERLLSAAQAEIAEQLHALEEQIQGLRQDAQMDTKSSAGDKYETSREMLQQSERLLQERYQNAQSHAAALAQLEVRPCDRVTVGALVSTNIGRLFVGVGMGSMQVEGQTIYFVSAQAPIVTALAGAKVGDPIHFNGKKS
ncbi:hypothetical protein A3SI_02321 [Nitritalea halalkaliphila LW7]|uniref:3-oxoacyl-ACP synthase n=1 Tax=Nitritalea halalkaliphila LW7 TaxID=1189621 RepID=I5C9Q8_9BACT|nr:hypothetical protein [Nitritalea halalkaliphila]EIM78560.1 hypothetical protein A3SI_02321 [Nitritalea halalkaliphila LW7]